MGGKMIKTKKQLIKIISEIADFKINQAIEFKTLAKSMKQNQEDKTLKEWLVFVNCFLEKLKGGIK